MHEDFSLLHTAILDYFTQKGYNESKCYKYAKSSSGSPISIELQLHVILFS
jgi:hypothetical protein